MGILSKKIVKNAMWNIGGKFFAQAITPLFAILIARILNPVDFGLFAIVAAIISFIDIIKDLGISQAVIIEHNDNDLISLQFTVQLFLGIAIYGAIFILARHIAFYFGMPALKMALIIYALMVFIYCIEYPLETLYMKNNKYNILFYRQLLPVLLYGVISYLLALKGFGVFALIIGHLFSRAMTACILLVRSNWKPKIYINLSMFLHLFKLGKHILVQSICGFFVSQADSLIIGKFLGPRNLGFYKTGNIFTHLIPNAITLQVQKVVFSDIAQEKDNYRYYNMRYYQFFYLIGLIMVMISIATYYFSPLFVDVIMGSKWNQMIPVAQIFSAALPTGMIISINKEYSKILGFNHTYTIYSIIRSIITLIAICVASLFSLRLTVICWVIVALLANTANEIFFFRMQRAIEYKKSRLIFFIFAWLWATYIIINSCCPK